MQFNLKDYQISKTKNYFAKKGFVIFVNGANQNYLNWILTEQGLHKLHFKYHKTYNNIAVKVLKHTIFKNLSPIISSTFFFLEPKLFNKKYLNKNALFASLKKTQLTIFGVKSANKLYSVTQLKNLPFFNYNASISLLYQCLLLNLKAVYSFHAAP